MRTADPPSSRGRDYVSTVDTQDAGASPPTRATAKGGGGDRCDGDRGGGPGAGRGGRHVPGYQSQQQRRRNSAVYVYDGVEIAGPGANQVTLDAQGADRILSLYGLPADNRRVAVSDLTLQGGYADYGGAIYGPDADLEIARSTITGNTATGSGGAVYK